MDWNPPKSKSGECWRRRNRFGWEKKVSPYLGKLRAQSDRKSPKRVRESRNRDDCHLNNIRGKATKGWGEKRQREVGGKVLKSSIFFPGREGGNDQEKGKGPKRLRGEGGKRSPPGK